jgi:hypothetical protein
MHRPAIFPVLQAAGIDMTVQATQLVWSSSPSEVPKQDSAQNNELQVVRSQGTPPQHTLPPSIPHLAPCHTGEGALRRVHDPLHAAQTRHGCVIN